MSGPTPRALARLGRAVAVLALPAPDQLAWVESLGVGPAIDELALELNEGVRLAHQFVEANWLPAAALEPLRHLDRLLESMSGQEHQDLGEVGALESSSSWSDVRERAKAVLNVIN